DGRPPFPALRVGLAGVTGEERRVDPLDDAVGLLDVPGGDGVDLPRRHELRRLHGGAFPRRPELRRREHWAPKTEVNRDVTDRGTRNQVRKIGWARQTGSLGKDAVHEGRA